MPVGTIDKDHNYGSRAPSPKLQELEEKMKSTREDEAPKLQELEDKIKLTQADKAVKKRMVVLPFVLNYSMNKKHRRQYIPCSVTRQNY